MDSPLDVGASGEIRRQLAAAQAALISSRHSSPQCRPMTRTTRPVGGEQ